MIRTQISLDGQEYDRAKREAKARGISIAEFVRRAVRDAIPADAPDAAEKPWMEFAGLVESGDPRSSQTVDEIVYGQKD
jgi:hypothetical protein